jgi:tyrosine-protein kinase Etk/Wzc
MNSSPVVKKKKEVDSLKVALAKLVRYRVLFASFMMISVAASLIYLRYSTPEYKINAKVMIKDDKKGGNLGNQALIEEIGLLNGVNNVDNEVEVFKSRSLMERVVWDMQLYVSYYVPGNIKESEQFANMPFTFRLDPISVDSFKKSVFIYDLAIKDGHNFTLTGSGHTWKGELGIPINLPIGKAVVLPTSVPAYGDLTYTVQVENPDITIDRYMQALSVSSVNKQVSVVRLTLKDKLPKKGEKVLDNLIQAYMQANVDDKNIIADSTMAFIDSRLALVGNELSGLEQEIEHFKKSNELTDMGEQSRLLLGSGSEAAKELSEKQVQFEITQTLENYLKTNSDKQKIVPSSLVVQSTGAKEIIEQYNILELKKERLLLGSTPDNPIVQNIDEQLSTLKANILANISAIRKELSASILNLQRQAGSIQGKIRTVPTTERIFLEYSRQQNIKQELYVFLLKTREETAVGKSSSIANAKVIDKARSERTPFTPLSSLVIITGLIAGLCIPSAIVLVLERFNNRITTKSDITDVVSVPIIGEISHNDETDVIAIQKNTHTTVAEQFRALRTNLRFQLAGRNKKTILVTSSISGEGKTYLSINLANALAFSGKKVALLEFDMRKPGIIKALNLKYDVGISNYILDEVSIEEIIKPIPHTQNLFVLPCGIIPPDPSELIMMPQVGEMIEYLKQHFDFIVIDSAPIGLVTDAQLLAEFADMTIYVIRQSYTPKHHLDRIAELQEDNKIPKLCLVVNDIQVSYGYGYGYGYSSGYSYGNYTKYGSGNNNKRPLKNRKAATRI